MPWRTLTREATASPLACEARTARREMGRGGGDRTEVVLTLARVQCVPVALLVELVVEDDVVAHLPARCTARTIQGDAAFGRRSVRSDASFAAAWDGGVLSRTVSFVTNGC